MRKILYISISLIFITISSGCSSNKSIEEPNVPTAIVSNNDLSLQEITPAEYGKTDIKDIIDMDVPNSNNLYVSFIDALDQSQISEIDGISNVEWSDEDIYYDATIYFTSNGISLEASCMMIYFPSEKDWTIAYIKNSDKKEYYYAMDGLEVDIVDFKDK